MMAFEKTARTTTRAAILGFCVGCSPAAERPTELAEPPPSIADPPPPSSSGASGGEPLPGSLAQLGENCPDPLPESLRCGSTGRVSGVFGDAYTYMSLPPGAESLYERHSSDDQRSAVLVSFDGPTVWLQVLQCGGCQKLLGWSFVGYSADLTDAQLQEVARKANLPDGPPLRTRVDWAEAPWDVAFEAIPKGTQDAGAATSAGPAAPKSDAADKPEKTPAKTKPAGDAPKKGDAGTAVSGPD